MITARTKVQLVIFVILTVVGVTYVGARYARLDRLVVDDTYTVVAHFKESGGIFASGQVTYRGVRVGEVEKLELTDEGVDVHLGIDDEHDDIPADTLALVGNRSAVGEQYVELQPRTDGGAVLEDGSEIAPEDTRTPLQTDQLLTDISRTTGSVDLQALQTTISELGEAFGGTGEDLQRIIDSGNRFIEAANDNFDVTTALIRDSNVVLQGQIASEGSLRTFASDLSQFSRTLADADGDLRRVIDTGSFSATQLRTFLEANRVELADLIRNVITYGEVVYQRLPGVRQVLALYPFIVEGSFTVASRPPGSDVANAHFGLIINSKKACTAGYDPGEKRPPQDGSNKRMDLDAGCTEPPSVTNARGAQNIPRRVPVDYTRSPVVATYDPTTSRLDWAEDGDRLAPTGTVAPRSLGEESWKWLYLQPLMTR